MTAGPVDGELRAQDWDACNGGAAVGAGATYWAEDLVGVEITAEEAERAERNVRLIDPSGVARVIAEDAVEAVVDYPRHDRPALPRRQR
jgi:hypothetical protein